jgi:hypothetical protein
LVKGLKRLHADNVGTVCKTDVLNKTPKTLAIREVLGNKFGVGNSTFRTGIDHEQEVETVPFGCWRKEVFEKYGKYDVYEVLTLRRPSYKDSVGVCSSSWLYSL